MHVFIAAAAAPARNVLVNPASITATLPTSGDGSELVANKKSYENRIQQLDEPSEFSHALVPNNTVDYVYKTLLDKIGLLSEDEVENILKAYLLIADLPYRIRILVGTDSIGGFNDEHINAMLRDAVRDHNLTLHIINRVTPDRFMKELNDKPYGEEIAEGICGYFPYTFEQLFPPNQADTMECDLLCQNYFDGEALQ